MAGNFNSQMRRFIQALEEMPRAAEVGGERALTDIKDDWVLEARDVAPLDSGNLRRQIDGEVSDNTLVVSSNATNSGRFNYAYYIHEQDAGGHGLKTTGTVKKFLDEPAEQRKETWLDWIEEEVDAELRQGGVNVTWQR